MSVSLVSLLFVGFLQQASVSVPLPNGSATASNVLICKELVSSSFKQDASGSPELKAEIHRGSEGFRVTIAANEVRIVTVAELRGGLNEGTPMRVVINDGAVLSAWSNDDKNTISSLLVNKRDGLAVWTRTRASGFLGGPAPELQTVYFTCAVR